jgi:hypothetical protein
MSSRQIARLGLGITGIWALIYALSGFMSVAALIAFQGRETLGAALVGVGPAAGLLFVGYVLVFHNDRAVTVIFPDFGADDGAPTTDIAPILVALTGILVLGSAIPGVVSGLIGLMAAARFGAVVSRGAQVQGFTGRLVQAAFGVFLVVRPQRLLAYLRRPADEAVN